MGLTVRLLRLLLRRWLLVGLIPLLVLLAWAFAPPPGGTPDATCHGSARCFSGFVTHIEDGDTLDVGGQTIRLALVDTPEWDEPGFHEATQFTARLCPVGSRALVDEDDGQTAGSRGRIVAVVYCGSTNLNAELLRAGHAVILTEFCAVSEFADEPWAIACH